MIISNRIIDDYSEGNLDTLHKKNLFSLGEDRYLTTLMMKHFPTFKTKFILDAVARTFAPESFRVLFSQRRRWINSTVHNLCELVLLPERFGFCCCSMRFFVFIVSLCLCAIVLLLISQLIDLTGYCRLRKYPIILGCSLLNSPLVILPNYCRGYWTCSIPTHLYHHDRSDLWPASLLFFSLLHSDAG